MLRLSIAATLLSTSALLTTGAFAQTAAPATPSPAPADQVPSKSTDATGAVNAAAPATPPAAAEDTAALQEITVTATRREVNLQKVPATVEAVPATTLKALNVTGVLQLPSLVSGLVVTPSGGNNIYLRGIGSASTGFNEAQTAVYIDGLYLANPTAGIYSFNNIDRIEVLKGPQGTLYGRNVTGGLISVTTRDPGSVPRLDASVGYANYDTVTANLYASTPVTDTLAVNVAGFHQKQSDGWSTNTFNGHDGQRSNESGVEAKAQWRPASGTKITGTFIYDYNNRDLGYAYEVYPGTVGTDGTPYLGHYKFTSRIDSKAPTNIYIGTVKVEQDLGFATLMSISGYQTSTANVLFQGGLPILGQRLPAPRNNIVGASYAPFYEHNRTYSQEFQLTSKPSSSRFDWVAGAFYYNDHSELRLDTYFTCLGATAATCGPGTPTRNDGFPTTNSVSGYADGTYRFFDATRLTVGLRYTSETKRLSGLVTPLPGLPDSVAVIPGSTLNPPPATGVTYPGEPYTLVVNGVPTVEPGIPTRLHFNKLTYRFVLAQDIGSNVHLYASHNLGFKSGAFNGNGFTNPPVKPELLYATEGGVKTELFDRRLRLNLAYFHYTYKDVQLRSTAPPAPPGNAILQNAASETINGVDGDFSVAVTRRLVLNGSFEYLHAKYDNFPGTTIAIPGTTTFATSAGGTYTIGTPTVLQNQNLGGFDVPFAPPFSASLGAIYTVETGVGTFSLSGNDHYNSPYSMVGDDSIRQKRHHVVDGSLNWTSSSKRFDVNLFVRNLTKQYVYAVAQESTNFAIVPAAPRTFGVTAGVHF